MPFGEAAADALRAYLPSRDALRHRAEREEARGGEPLFVNARGGRLTSRSMARLLKRRLRAAGPAGRDLAPRPAPYVRDAPPAGRRGPARDPGAARPRVAVDDAEVHAPRRGAAARGVPECASQGVGRFRPSGSWSRGCLIAQTAAPARPPLLAEIDRTIREQFLDPKLKGVDWGARGREGRRGARALRAVAERGRASTTACSRRSAIRTRSACRRAGCPSTTGARRGCASARTATATRSRASSREAPPAGAGCRIGDRVLAVDGGRYGAERVNFRDLFFVFEGAPGSAVEVTWQAGTGPPATRRSSSACPSSPSTRSSGRAPASSGATARPTATRASGACRAESALAIVDMLSDPQGRRGLAAEPRRALADRRVSPRRAGQQRRLRPQHPPDVSARTVERGRLLRDLARREAARRRRTTSPCPSRC